MWLSVALYGGAVAAAAGLAVGVLRWRRVARWRGRARAIAIGGAVLAAIALAWPSSLATSIEASSRLDQFMPAWQFREFHTRRVAAPPDEVYRALRLVRADEIALFRALTWVRRGGRPLPDTVLDAGDREPLLEVAVKGGFIWLADDAPRELVVGTRIVTPPGAARPLTPEAFRAGPVPGQVLAAMNFAVAPLPGGSRITTETRVFAADPASARRFAVYWRVIAPGSDLIRRMWLRAVDRRATTSVPL